MHSSLRSILAIATVSFFASGCASASSDLPAGQQTDAIQVDKGAPQHEASQGVRPLNAPLACSSSDWATAQSHADSNHYVWSPGGGYWPTVVSCSVSGNTITYGYVYN